MKTTNLLFAGAAMPIALFAFAQPALADGVDAGTLIENTATANFTVGATPQSVDSNTVVITVDELLNVTLTSQDAAAVPIDGAETVLTYEVTNTGNGPEAFDLTADPSVAGNDFDPVVERIVIDTNGNGIYEPGVDEELPPGTPTDEIPADGSLTVFVIVTAPAGVTDGQTGEVNLLAEATTGTGAPGTSFDGQGEGGGAAVVGLSGADADDNGEVVTGVPTVVLVKSATVLDPFGGDQAVPGSVITFTIRADVTGGGSISDFRITDAIPDDTTYSAGSLTLDGTGLTDADDADAGEASAAGIDVLIGTATPTTDYTVTFDVTID